MLPECKVKVIRTAATYAGDLEQMPELPLSLDLHLHHRVVGILDALQGLLNAWEQVNDLLLANQDLTVEEKGRELGGALLCKRLRVPTVPPVATRTRGGCKGP